MTNSPATARDALANRIENLFYIQESGVARMDWGDMADAMITALHDAGYDIVRRGTDAADVEARARETLELAVSYGVDGAVVTPDLIAALTAAGLRIVDAAQDDRRSEALAAGIELGRALFRWDMCVGKESCTEALVRLTAARIAFAPYWRHDGDTGGEW